MRLAGCCAFLIAIAIAGPAAAQRVYEAEGTVNLGFTTTITGNTFQADPMAEPEDVPATVDNRAYTEVRPSIAMQTGSERYIWRFAYTFAGNLALDSSGTTTYNNQAEASFSAQATKFTQVSLSSSAAQGSQTFLLTSRSPDQGQVDIRAPGNPSLIAASLAQALNMEVTPQTSFSQSLIGTYSSPQDDFSNYSAALTGTLGLGTTLSPLTTIGMEARGSMSRLQPLRAGTSQYSSYTTSLVGRLNHDFTASWNAIASAGVEQVYTDAGSKPLAFTPTGSIAALYGGRDWAGGIDASHSTLTNIQVGTVSVSDRVAARGIYTMDLRKRRTASASIGFLHNEPIGEAEAVVAAGTGYAAQLDAGFITEITPTWLFNARYSMAYQFGQAGGLGDAFAQIILVGVTATYSSYDPLKVQRLKPARGRRVDNMDGMFPVVDEPLEQAP